VGDANVVLALVRDGALNTGGLFTKAANIDDGDNGESYYYKAVKWALVLSADLLYGDLQVIVGLSRFRLFTELSSY
jgi:hypothetical protein